MLILFCNHVFSFIIAPYFMSVYFRKIAPVVQKAINDVVDDSKKYTSEMLQSDIVNGVDTIRFIILSAIFISCLFVLFFLFPNKITNSFVKDILSTGIHIPFLLGCVGFILNVCVPNLDKEIKRNAFLMVAISINIAFLVFDWRIALLVFSIIVGKFVWIDFVFEKNSVLHYLTDFIKSEDTCNLLIKNSCFVSTSLFYELYLLHIFLERVLGTFAKNELYLLPFEYLAVATGYYNYLKNFNP